MTWWRLAVRRHTPDIFPFPISYRKVCNSAFFLQRVTPCALPKGCIPRRGSRLSGVVRFDVVQDFFWSQGTIDAKKHNCLLQYIDSHFCGLESFDVNCGRDLVLNVVPVRDDQLSGPTSSRFQRVSGEDSRKNVCTKLMKTAFVFRRDWINKILSTKGAHGP